MEFIACFVLIIILIRFKIPVGVTLIITALLLAILEFGLSKQFIEPFFRTLAAWQTWKIIATVFMVIVLGEILSHIGYLERMVKALNAYVSPRTVAMVAPALIGLLPMPGGAMVSAPIVEELAKNSPATADDKTIANYWWRHLWEPIWPLYQSVILAAAIFSVSVWQIAAICFPITISCIIAGLLIVKLPLAKTTSNKAGIFYFIKEMVASLWPVLFIILTGIFLKLDLVVSLLVLYLVLLLCKITNFKMIRDGFIHGFSFDIILIFLGGLVLMDIIKMGQAAGNTLLVLQNWHVPIDLVVFALPFLVGLLTGLTAAYVGVGFPIIGAAMISTGSLNSGILLAYTGGLMGIMVSPVHLCLVLTKRYFKADFRGLYIKLIPVVLLASLLIFIIKYLFYAS